jgi:hypothetical protein
LHRALGTTKLDAWSRTLAIGLDASRDNPAYQLWERLMRGITAPICTREGLFASP